VTVQQGAKAINGGWSDCAFGGKSMW